MDQGQFQAKFGAVFEHSPWVADAVFATGIDGLPADADRLSDRFQSVFMLSDPELQLATLRAHPELVCALAEPGELTTTSAREQSGAGLDRCSEAEYHEFSHLNAAYRARFGFPFIIAVKGNTRDRILCLFKERMENDAVTEYQTAVLQVCRIARFRIKDILDA